MILRKEECSMIYGYVRISTAKQNIERQIRNILSFDPDAKIIEEIYTGTKIQGRKKFDDLLKKVRSGDTIIFDSVSRMSRNSEDGINTYFALMDRGVNLIFLKERYIDTATYQNEIKDRIALTGTDEDELFKGINNYFRKLAKRQIQIAFDQAQKEVDDLHQRTKEGIETARRHGKQIGRAAGHTYATKKSLPAKEIIRKHNKNFGGSLSNEETWKLAGISKMTFYKYQREILEEMAAESQG